MRGKKFSGAHVHSILKKRLAKEELLNREYPPVWSDFSMEVVDKTILMSDFGFPNSLVKLLLMFGHLGVFFAAGPTFQSLGSDEFNILCLTSSHHPELGGQSLKFLSLLRSRIA